MTKYRFNWDNWDIGKELADDSTIALIGPRGTGKTTCIVDILKQKMLRRGIVMCPSPACYRTYDKLIPRSYLYNYFSEDIIQKIFDFQTDLTLRFDAYFQEDKQRLKDKHDQKMKQLFDRKKQMLIKQMIKENKSEKDTQKAFIELKHEMEDIIAEADAALDKHCFDLELEYRKHYCMWIILDDFSSDPKAMRSEKLKFLINNGRHYWLLLIIAVQFCLDLHSSIRGGLDWVVLFYDPSKDNLEKLYKKFAGGTKTFATIKIFEDALVEAKLRGCGLVVRKNKMRVNVKENVFLIKTQRTFMPKYKFGDKLFSYVHDLFYSDSKFKLIASGTNDNISSKKKESKKTEQQEEIANEMGDKTQKDSDDEREQKEKELEETRKEKLKRKQEYEALKNKIQEHAKKQNKDAKEIDKQLKLQAKSRLNKDP